MAESSSTRAGRVGGADPLSFYISDLSTANETESGIDRALQMNLEQITEENSTNRSSGYLTALPNWESIKRPRRPKIYVPLPVVPRRAHIRTVSQSPILEKDALSKETAELNRSGSQRSIFKAPASTPPAEKQPRRRQMIVCLVGIGIFIVVLAIILGTVLTIYLTPTRTSPLPTVTQIPAGTDPTPTSTPTVSSDGGGSSQTTIAIPHLASVTVTGWSVPGSDGYHAIWLFWQHTEGYLSRAAFNSSTGNWTRVTKFTEARKDTALAATALSADWYAGQENYTFPDMQYQASVVFVDGKNHLKEWIFPDSGPEIGQPGPLAQQKYIAHEDTKIASYWPHIVYQGTAGEIRKAHYACHEENECWHERVLSTTEARNGTQLVLTPLQNNSSSRGLFYQEQGGRVLEFAEDENFDGSLWENSAFSERIPPNASIAAFSTTRTASPTDPKLNTYLLWQDADDTIQMSWTNNDIGWQGPISYPAFAGAEPKTALSCLTGLTFSHFPLQTGTELARCYFQTGRALREVSFDGDSWNIVGVVPVDF